MKKEAKIAKVMREFKQGIAIALSEADRMKKSSATKKSKKK